jgi:hypothetical protein
MSKKNNRKQLVVYNANKPTELFTVLFCNMRKSAECVTVKQYETIQRECDGGPYLCFFRDEPDAFYTFLKMVHPLDCLGENPSYGLLLTKIRYDEKQQEIVACLLRKICELELTKTWRLRKKS